MMITTLNEIKIKFYTYFIYILFIVLNYKLHIFLNLNLIKFFILIQKVT